MYFQAENTEGGTFAAKKAAAAVIKSQDLFQQFFKYQMCEK